MPSRNLSTRQKNAALAMFLQYYLWSFSLIVFRRDLHPLLADAELKRWHGIAKNAHFITSIMAFRILNEFFRRSDHREDVRAHHDSISVVAQSGARTAATAQRRRNVSPDQMDGVCTKLAGVDLSGIRVAISYIPDATDADTFAASLEELLSQRLQVHCQGPTRQSMNAGPQPKPEIIGTKVMVSRKAGKAAERLADVLDELIEEVTVGGEDMAWPFQTTMYAMKIIVGHKR